MAPHKIVVLPTFAPWRTHRPVPKWGQKGHFRTPFGTPLGTPFGAWVPTLGAPHMGPPWDPMGPHGPPGHPQGPLRGGALGALWAPLGTP